MNNWLTYENQWVNLIHSSVVFLKKTNERTIHHTHAKRALNRIIRAWTDYPPKYISINALKLFKKANISPTNKTRKDYLILGRINNKSKIVFEHTTPVNEFITRLLTCNLKDEIRDEMKNYSGVCWITRKEDDLLNKNKFRINRYGKWKECYEKCDIHIINLYDNKKSPTSL